MFFLLILLQKVKSSKTCHQFCCFSGRVRTCVFVLDSASFIRRVLLSLQASARLACFEVMKVTWKICVASRTNVRFRAVLKESHEKCPWFVYFEERCQILIIPETSCSTSAETRTERVHEGEKCQKCNLCFPSSPLGVVKTRPFQNSVGVVLQISTL